MRIQRVEQNYPLDLLQLADPSEERIKSYLPKSQVFVLEEAGEAIGCYALQKLTATQMEVMNIAVSEKRQGEGLGKILLNHAVQEAKKAGARDLHVGTGNSSIGQVAFYQKMGFRLTAIKLDFFTENYEEPIFENGLLCRDMWCFSREI
ncbi:GNAT family N-acetyltransferase [Listeria costaricensis]|uniref:GNAT family N-acetyltransferase n=1 Tax=Listeria costaricensis TaxID=2026604 RepID=UPI000C07FF40|nr:GNAT family N-acetyltransferase [Listeria costaricensis]